MHSDTDLFDRFIQKEIYHSSTRMEIHLFHALSGETMWMHYRLSMFFLYNVRSIIQWYIIYAKLVMKKQAKRHL